MKTCHDTVTDRKFDFQPSLQAIPRVRPPCPCPLFLRVQSLVSCTLKSYPSKKEDSQLGSLKRRDGRRDAVATSGLQHSLVGGMLLATFTDSLH